MNATMDMILQTSAGVFLGGIMVASVLWAMSGLRKHTSWDTVPGLMLAAFIMPLTFMLIILIAYS